MKNPEYYNYYKPRKRLWWIPLVAVLVCVIGVAVYKSLSAKSEPAPAPASDTAATENGVRITEDGNLRRAEVDGTVHWILAGEYEGEYRLQRIRFHLFSETPAPLYGVTDIPVEEPAEVHPDFPQATVMTVEDYAETCALWGVEQLWTEPGSSVLVLAQAEPGAQELELHLADVRIDGSVATVYLQADFSGSGPTTAGYMLTLPVSSSVLDVQVVPVMSQAAFDALMQSRTAP